MTHFSICHSFLDYRYIGFPAIRGNRLSGRTLNNILFQIAQWHSGTVAQLRNFFCPYVNIGKLKWI